MQSGVVCVEEDEERRCGVVVCWGSEGDSVVVIVCHGVVV